MKNVSFKHWIVAGALSGIITAILVFALFSIVIEGKIVAREISALEGAIKFEFFLYSYAFLGLLTGIILFLIRNKLTSKRLLKIILVSVGTFCLLHFVSVFGLGYLAEIEYAFSYENRIGAKLIEWVLNFFAYSPLGPLWGISLLFLWVVTAYFPVGILFYILEGAVFGLLINYFINRMERKASK